MNREDIADWVKDISVQLTYMPDFDLTVRRTPFVIPGWVHSARTLWYGQSGIGKSFLLAKLCRSLVFGEEFAGQVPHATVDRILYVAADDADEIKERVSAQGLGGHVGVLSMASGPVDWRELILTINALSFEFLIIDPVGPLVGNTSNEEESARFLSGCQRVVDETGIPVLMVAHVSIKTDADGKPKSYVGQSPMGSSAWVNSPRWLVELASGGGAGFLASARGWGNAGKRWAADLRTEMQGDTDARMTSLKADHRAAVTGNQKQERETKRDRWLDAAEEFVEEVGDGVMSPTEASRWLAEHYSEMTKAKDPARGIAQHFSKGNGVGRFLEVRDGKVYRRTVETYSESKRSG